jgi:hypothetical protein
MDSDFRIAIDARARAWLDAHPGDATRVISYELHRCCGGGGICQVNVRALSKKDRVDDYAPASLDDGTAILIDRRAAKRLPPRFALTVSGLGPLKHLDLALDGEEWGELLYT